MLTKRLIVLVVLTLFATVLPAISAAQKRGFSLALNGSLHFNSDYTYRGISFTEGKRNVQGQIGLTTSGTGGFRMGVIVSSISHANAEYQWYSDYSQKIGPGVYLGVHLKKYEYIGLTCTNALSPVPDDMGRLQVPDRDCVVGQNSDYDEYGLSAKINLTFGELHWRYYENKDSDNPESTAYNEFEAKIPLLGVWARLGEHNTGYQFIRFGLGKRFGRFELELSYLRPTEDASESDLLSNLRNVSGTQASEQLLTRFSVHF